MSAERDRQGPTGGAVADHIVPALTRNRPGLTMSTRVIAGHDCRLRLRRRVISPWRDHDAIRRDACHDLDQLAGL
jgi:hypothetical protein